MGVARDVLHKAVHGIDIRENATGGDTLREGTGERAAPDVEHDPLDDELTLSQEVRRVRIDALRTGDSPRSNGTDAQHVRTLAAVDAPLPPIYVHHDTMSVIDGMHRVDAARLNGRDDIDVRFFYGSIEEAFRLAVRVNVTHGLPLTFGDRQAAAVRIIRSRPQLSDRAIAATAGLGARSVAALRKQLVSETNAPTSRIGRDGRVRPLSTAEGRRIASEALAARPDASLRQIAKEAGVSVGTVRDVRERLKAGKDPVPPRQSGQQKRPAEDPVAPRLVDRAASELNPETMLDGLRRDPSLRYTESGRELLRWLSTHSMTMDDWRKAVEVPPHCAIVVAKIAKEYARAWQDLAVELDRRSRGGVRPVTLFDAATPRSA